MVTNTLMRITKYHIPPRGFIYALTTYYCGSDQILINTVSINNNICYDNLTFIVINIHNVLIYLSFKSKFKSDN